jgi:hypothetical protein
VEQQLDEGRIAPARERLVTTNHHSELLTFDLSQYPRRLFLSFGRYEVLGRVRSHDALAEQKQEQGADRRILTTPGSDGIATGVEVLQIGGEMASGDLARRREPTRPRKKHDDLFQVVEILALCPVGEPTCEEVRLPILHQHLGERKMLNMRIYNLHL